MTKIKLVACLLLGALVLAATAAEAVEYIVGPGDVLKISVYEHDDLEMVVRVDGDGTLRMPLIGQVKVSGLSVPEITARITLALKGDYIVSPEVSVFIEEFRSQKTVIMGEVKSPGLYELKGYTTFLELASIAGGLTENAGDVAIVQRKAGGRDSILTVDLQLLIEHGETSHDIQVVDGDTVIVSKAGVIYVTGEVKKPDSYKFVEGTTVIQAITLAGGFTSKAAVAKVKIIRKGEAGGKKVMDKARMDALVYPNDVIVVPESFF